MGLGRAFKAWALQDSSFHCRFRVLSRATLCTVIHGNLGAHEINEKNPCSKGIAPMVNMRVAVIAT